MKFPVLRSGLCCYTEGWGGKCSEILATIKLLYNPRVNKVFTALFTSLHERNKYSSGLNTFSLSQGIQGLHECSVKLTSCDHEQNAFPFRVTVHDFITSSFVVLRIRTIEQTNVLFYLFYRLDQNSL